MKVSAVVVTYNRVEMLKEVISALLSSKARLNHVIVIDNNSDKATQDFLLSMGSSIEYVRLTENLGGAGGFNRGIRYFMEHTEDDAVWLMDDDTVPDESTLSSLIDFADTIGSYGFLASDVRWIDGSRALMNNLTLKNGLGKVPEDATQSVKVANATFVSLLMSRDIIQKIGLPITEFFIWGDDIEYTERAERIAPGYFVPKANVVHKMSKNVGTNIVTDDEERIPRYYFAYRNKMYYGRKRGWIGHLKSNLRIMADAFQILITPNVSRRRERLSSLIRGVIDGRRFNPKIEYLSSDH
ncbi:glycosyltransferase family 2 protein [Weissella confusa]|uniref:glycosyltransferase family 2 protein n=1 Tax=Weissella confusa TaxID=1583 RepID=UPI0013E07956|nr:glycosyltransferase family 2 protein [Weissella confusa]MBJ7670861.1 glycosyltransferase [Weissella confusa]QIE79061.1 glycosyltransferase [Weissella confusa]